MRFTYGSNDDKNKEEENSIIIKFYKFVDKEQNIYFEK